LEPKALEALLLAVSEGRLSPADAAERLKTLPYEDLGFAKLDHHRALRRGFPEVVFGAGKTPEQIQTLVDAMASEGQNVLVTRVSGEAVRAIVPKRGEARYHEVARCLTVEVKEIPPLPGRVAVVSAGTSDQAVAEEAWVTASFHGATVDRVYDVGVAGLHRLLDKTPLLRKAKVVIVVAGMEGALPSVVGGLLAAPVIAVPTSVGYGAAFHGLAALLAMLNSCASGVAVVNIDNGFGAGYMAAAILRQVLPEGKEGELGVGASKALTPRETR
jgi:NCAIR mutase (PurE)-related protein